MTSQIKGLIRFAMGLLVGLALMTSCGGDQAPQREVGQLSLTLQSTSASGVLFQLRFAVFDILNVTGGPGSASVSSEDFPPEAPEILVELPNGRYQVTLQDGWFMQHSANGQPFTEIQAELVSVNPVRVDVVAAQVTGVTFVFEVDSDTIIFGPGTLSIDFEVEEVTPLTVFVTAAPVAQPLGAGVTGADSRCQAEAERAGLSGTFRAWLSTSSYWPADDWANWSLVGDNYRFVRPDGNEIAESWQDLTDGELAWAPGMMADGTIVAQDNPGDFEVWTGTLQIGTPAFGETCDDWTSRDPAQQALVGDARFTSSAWTRARTVACDDIYNRRWYCFEQIECNGNEECGVSADQCNASVCLDQQCTLEPVPDGTPCSPGPQCDAGDGMCSAGVCESTSGCGL